MTEHCSLSFSLLLLLWESQGHWWVVGDGLMAAAYRPITGRRRAYQQAPL